MEIKHILIPVDFSPCSINALKQSVRMAKEWESKLFIIHASQVPESYMTIAGTYTPIDYESVQKEVDSAFDTLVKQVPELNDIDYVTQSINTELIEALFTEVQTKQIDLIIMGTKSEHNKLEKVLGTHAAEVIEATSTPVLIMPGETVDFAPTKIGFATDARSITNVSRLGYIAAFASHFNASIEIFFVAKEGEAIDFEASTSKAVIERYFDGLRYTFKNVVNEDVLKGITEHIDNSDIDMLTMIPRHHDIFYRWIHGSTTRHMAQNLSIPLLALPE